MLVATDFSFSIASLGIATIAALFSIYTFSTSHRKRRKKLINAVYYHVKETKEWLGHSSRKEKHEAIRKKIEEGKGYMPYPVFSSADDLSYEHIIEAMEWLSSKKTGGGESEEELLSRYFHQYMHFRAYLSSFEKYLLMDWPTDRKLAIWQGFANAQEKTLNYANKLMPILGNKKNSRIHRVCSTVIHKARRPYERPEL